MPKTLPSKNDPKTEPIKSHTLISALISSTPSKALPTKASPTAIPAPKAAPINPPMLPINPDYIKKRENIELFLAPMAFIMPICRVLSSTDVYIVFIIPMPPTTMDIPAMIYTKS